MKFPHHVHVLNLLHSIPTTCTTAEATAAFDHIFEYIHAHFPVPDSAIDDTGNWPYLTTEMKNKAMDCRTMLLTPAALFETNLESLPPYYCNIIFPMSVARYMLRECRMPVNHRYNRTFSEFHRRYGPLVLSTCC